MKSQIKAVVFDWGGVLVDNPTKQLLEYSAKFFGVSTEKLLEVFSPYENDFQRGILSEKILIETLKKKLNANASEGTLFWKDAIRKSIHEKKAMYSLTKELKSRGYTVGFLSNTESAAVEYFYEKKYDSFFDVILFSCVENLLKPEKEIYLLLLEKLSLESNEVIFIDDKPENVEGAEKAGLHGILFTSEEQIFSDLENLLQEEGLKTS